MKKILLIAAFAITNLMQAQTINRCGTTEYQSELEKQNPWVVKNREKIERFTQDFVQQREQNKSRRVNFIRLPLQYS